MFENIQARLEQAIKRIRGQAKITESNISEALQEIRDALLDADVNFHVAKQFIDDVRTKALGQEVQGRITPGQLIVKIMYDEMVLLMGSTRAALVMSPQPPTVIVVAGLQGSGKTTFCGKLAKHLKKQGKQPLLVAADVYRPAAIEQLKLLAQQVTIPVYTQESSSPVSIAKEAVEYAKRYARDVVIIDTAGRLSIDEEMMQEAENIKTAVKPHEILFVCDSMTGQDAVHTAKAFHDRLAFTGVVLTKMDGDTRGGAALSIRAVVQKPIKFISTGEKLDNLEPFYPDRIASRILGMGDILTLVERAQAEFDEEQAKKLEQKILKNDFNFEDFLEQIQHMKKMGSLRDLLGMLPGMDKALRNVQIDEKALVRVEAIIYSMTKQERRQPKIINGSRRKRIAQGSGTSIQDVNRVLKQFEDMQKIMKQMTKAGGNMKALQNLMNQAGVAPVGMMQPHGRLRR
ncbi:MAG: signal recognition particle protein [Bacteroidota bacterium]|nr:signal recognition particle protein [Candidatus Kapabacteria bacterium]MDW8220029.1 signal recognition particle protein [Bacteroidota bacterium]